MKTPEGRLQVVGVGDAVGDAQVIEVAEGRVVMERFAEEDPETIIVRVNGRHQRIERIRKRGEAAPPLFAPAKTSAAEQGIRVGIE